MKLPALPVLRLPVRLSTRLALSLTLLLVLLLLLGGLALLHQYRSAALEAKEKQVHQLEAGVQAGLEALMLTGQAPLVQDWLERVREHPSIEGVAILRRDGTPAFRDLATLRRVNEFLGHQAFERPPGRFRSPQPWIRNASGAPWPAGRPWRPPGTRAASPTWSP